MLLFPAIDLRGGRCVRLYQGDFAAETVYDDDPAAVASRFVEVGAPWLHVVDLDAARTGELANLAQVAAIVTAAGAAGMPVQYGGGVRSVAAAARLADVGVARAVIGTAALENPGLVETVSEVLPVALGLDVRGREIAVRGWRAGSGVLLADLLDPERAAATSASSLAPAQRDLADLLASGAAVEALVVTQIATDGTLGGPDVDLLTEVLASTHIPLIASGGVGDLDDLRRLARLRVEGRSLEGAIVGRAVYEGTLVLDEALGLLATVAATPPRAVPEQQDGRPESCRGEHPQPPASPAPQDTRPEPRPGEHHPPHASPAPQDTGPEPRRGERHQPHTSPAPHDSGADPR